MRGCELITTSPDRSNIYYGVKPRTDINSDMLPLLKSLQEHKDNALRIIVYCPSLNMCTDLFANYCFDFVIHQSEFYLGFEIWGRSYPFEGGNKAIHTGVPPPM